MLNVDGLKEQIMQTIKDVIIPAIKEIELARQPNKSEIGEQQAEQIANTFDELVTEPLAKLIASAIDYYIKNATITGTLITVGSPFTQLCVVAPAPTPMHAGKTPNTLGII